MKQFVWKLFGTSDSSGENKFQVKNLTLIPQCTYKGVCGFSLPFQTRSLYIHRGNFRLKVFFDIVLQTKEKLSWHRLNCMIP